MSVNPKVYFYIQGAYVDITSYVLGIQGRNAIRITWGTKDQAGKDSPIRCVFRLFDPNGDLNPDNPYSTYYRKFSRKGTKVKIEASGTTRLIGELNSLRPASNMPGGSDTVVDVEVVSFSRRDKRSTQVLESPMYRAVAADLTGVISWRPLEEESDATSFRTPVTGEPNALATAGTINFGSYGDHPGTVRMPTFAAGGQLFWEVSPHVATGQYAFLALGYLPQAGFTTAAGQLVRLYFKSGSGNCYFIDINFNPSPLAFNVTAYGSGGIIDTTSLLTGIDSTVLNRSFMLTLELTQSGADVTVGLTIWNDGAHPEIDGPTLSVQILDTLLGVTMGTMSFIDFGQSDISGTSWNHFILTTDTSKPAQILGNLARRAWAGQIDETAAYRILHLCDDAGISLTGPNSGAYLHSTLLGPTGTAKSREQIIVDAAQADGGILGQTRTSEPPGYFFIPRYDMYSRAPKVWLTLSHLTSFTPTDGDFGLANAVKASRVGGTQWLDSVDSPDGYHFTTEDPIDSPDGIGSDNEADGGDLVLWLDDQVKPTAEWMTHVASWKEQRYPAIVVDLLRTAVASNATLVASLLDTYLGDVLSIDMTGANLRWQETERVLAVAYGGVEDIAQKQHDLTFITRPARVFEAWQVDSSGSSTVFALGTGNTSLYAATSLGPEWEENEVPYLIQAAGEAMRVTTCVTKTVAFIALGTASTANNASTTPGIPASMVAGDGPPDQTTMILAVSARPGAAGTIGTPTGWTVLLDAGNIKIMGRYYQAGDAAPTVTYTGGAAGDDVHARISGWSGLSLEKAGGTKATPAHASQSNGSATDIAYPALPIKRDGALVLYYGARADDATSVATLAGATELYDTALTAGNDMHAVADYVIQVFADDIPAGSFTVTTAGGAAVSRAAVVALRPTQEMTVVRNQNNVNVSIAAGSAINGWRMGVNGL